MRPLDSILQFQARNNIVGQVIECNDIKSTTKNLFFFLKPHDTGPVTLSRTRRGLRMFLISNGTSVSWRSPDRKNMALCEMSGPAPKLKTRTYSGQAFFCRRRCTAPITAHCMDRRPDEVFGRLETCGVQELGSTTVGAPAKSMAVLALASSVGKQVEQYLDELLAHLSVCFFFSLSTIVKRTLISRTWL